MYQAAKYPTNKKLNSLNCFRLYKKVTLEFDQLKEKICSTAIKCCLENVTITLIISAKIARLLESYNSTLINDK